MWDAIREFLGTIIAFFYGLIPNVGVAIILLTIAIGIVMFPLTLKQTRSMKAMQEIQPELKRLQKDLKHDKQALQEATMALYREKGVNPAAGCLPLILQMPVWFALFQVLRQLAVHVQHLVYNLGSLPGIGSASVNMTIGNPEKFLPAGSKLALATQADTPLTFLWMDMRISPTNAFQSGFLTALPYLITIFVVMGTAYWQQRQTTVRAQTGGKDQQQPGQAVMKIFPIFFGFISFNLPAGLVVYFAASQFFRIGQQAMILRMDAKRPVKAAGSRGKQKPEKAETSGGGSGDGTGKPGPNGGGGRKKTTPPRRTTSSGREAGKPAPRRPQGSKKGRGKKRRKK
jgi:YidC/Oxa1 family membrane protein insertase